MKGIILFLLIGLYACGTMSAPQEVAPGYYIQQHTEILKGVRIIHTYLYFNGDTKIYQHTSKLPNGLNKASIDSVNVYEYNLAVEFMKDFQKMQADKSDDNGQSAGN